MPLLDGLTDDTSILGVSPEELARRAALRPGSRAYDLTVGATSQPRIPDRPILGSVPKGQSVTPGFDAASAEIANRPPDLPSMPILGGPAPTGILGSAPQPARPTPAADAYESLRSQGSPWQRESKLGKFADILGMTTGIGRTIEAGTGKGSLGYRVKLGEAQQAAQEEGRLGKAAQDAQFEIARTAEQQAKAEQERARADALKNPQDRAEAKTVQVGDKVMQWNSDTGRYDIEVGPGRTKPSKHSAGEIKLDEGIPTGVYGENDKLFRANDPALPPELKAALGDAQGAHNQKVQEQLRQAREGRSVMAGSKAINVMKGDGTIVGVDGLDLPQFIKDNPGSVIVGSGAPTQAMGKQALISDIRRAATNVSANLDVLDRTGFDYAKLGAALADPNGTAEAYLQSIPRGSLDDKAQQFVSDLFSLREQAMAMRSVLGAGQGSEDMRRAILQTLPGISSGSKGFGQKQIKNLIAALDTLERGVPNVPMRQTSQPAAGGFKPF